MGQVNRTGNGEFLSGITLGVANFISWREKSIRTITNFSVRPNPIGRPYDLFAEYRLNLVTLRLWRR